MILVTHSLIGAALTHRTFQYPAVFFIALASHYILDMLPHWHYSVPVLKKAVQAPFGKKTLRVRSAPYREIARVMVDLAIGLSLSLYFFSGSFLVIAVAVFGAAVPDLAVGLGRFYPIPILVAHDRFHRWIHSRLEFDDQPFFGIASQVGIALIFVFLFR